MFDYRSSVEFLMKCQATYDSDIKGTVSPWVLNEGDAAREDIHDTLQAIYIWSRPENIEYCGECLEMAIDYVKRSFARYRVQAEPIKSYDATYYILGLHNYLKRKNDKLLREIKRYAKNYLIQYFKEGPSHNGREYSNPYWKATVLYLMLTDKGENTRFIANWLQQDTTLVNPENEPDHMGRGYKYSHDFLSTFGTKLMAMNTILPDHRIESLEDLIPSGYTRRLVDEVPYNASVTFGLSTLNTHSDRALKLKVSSAGSEIFSVLESQVFEGGVKRGNYTQLRESWTTFFVYIAEMLREGKSIF